MSPERILTEQQKEQIRESLLQRKQAIEEEIKKGFTRILQDEADQTTVVDVEEGEESRVDVGKEMSYHVMSRRTQELKLINEALHRLETGQYGICDECGSPIRFERLKIMPFAQLCLRCQKEYELQERQKSGKIG